MAIFFLTITDM